MNCGLVRAISKWKGAPQKTPWSSRQSETSPQLWLHPVQTEFCNTTEFISSNSHGFKLNSLEVERDTSAPLMGSPTHNPQGASLLVKDRTHQVQSTHQAIKPFSLPFVLNSLVITSDFNFSASSHLCAVIRSLIMQDTATVFGFPSSWPLGIKQTRVCLWCSIICPLAGVQDPGMRGWFSVPLMPQDLACQGLSQHFSNIMV